MIESTFQLVRGVGPMRERLLWNSGVTCWDRLGDDAAGSLLSRRTGAPLRAAVTASRMALDRGDVDRLATALPASQHWRLFEAFGGDAAYLDIETGDDVWGRQSISAIGILDSAGPRLLLAGRDLDLFPALARAWSMLVTFNGLSFDVPTTSRRFSWRFDSGAGPHAAARPTRASLSMSARYSA